ncbi:MAG: hypothetical protein HEP71_03600 [Roseivirga sp.]|nr:hypothetical protein [Roseivirga sp.]
MKSVLNLKTTIAMAPLVLSLVGFTGTNTAYDPVGTWICEIESPDGDISTKITIAQNEEKEYEVAVITQEYGTLELSDVEIEGTEMTGNVEVAGGVADFELAFDGDEVEGTIYFGEDELPLTGEREKGEG